MTADQIAAAAPRIALAAWPWIVFPALLYWRTLGSRSLDDESPDPPTRPPTVLVVVPARNEARNIASCLGSLAASTYPALAIVVVDDHSTDGTGEIARAAAACDARIRVVDAPSLPAGWFGKQWACATGAGPAASELLLFVDADTTHAPDLVTRLVNARASRDAALLSALGRQELGSFWERVVQPQVLAVLAARYGGTERIAGSPRASDKIANGQCLLVTRAAYDGVGGHAGVCDSVSEDLVLAQRVFRAGGQVAIVLATRQLATRMYTSLGELVRGWRKNMYAGGRETMPFGALGRAIFPLLLLFPPFALLLPLVLVAAAATGLAPALTGAWALVALASVLAWMALVYRRAGAGARYALLYPLGAAVVLVIVLQAMARGRRVEWKGRGYTSR